MTKHCRTHHADEEWTISDPLALIRAVGSGIHNGEEFPDDLRIVGAGFLAVVLEHRRGVPTTPGEMYDACVDAASDPEHLSDMGVLFGVRP